MEITPETIINSKRKVYCKNCKFTGDWMFNLFGWRWCEVKELSSYYKENKDKGTDFTGVFPVFPSFLKYRAIRKTEKNSDGNCKSYRRKRWKFWIK